MFGVKLRASVFSSVFLCATSAPATGQDDFWSGGQSEQTSVGDQIVSEPSVTHQHDDFWSGGSQSTATSGDFWDGTSTSSDRHSAALIEAAASGDITELMVRIDLGAAIDARDQQGRTALWYASQNGHLDIVRHLLFVNGDPNIADGSGMTPMHAAAANLHTPILEELRIAGGFLNATTRGGETPFLLAMQNSTGTRMAQWFLDSGANPSIRDLRGQTAGAILNQRIAQEEQRVMAAAREAAYRREQQRQAEAEREAEQRRNEGMLAGLLVAGVTAYAGAEAGLDTSTVTNMAVDNALQIGNIVSGGQYAESIEFNNNLRDSLAIAERAARVPTQGGGGGGCSGVGFVIPGQPSCEEQARGAAERRRLAAIQAQSDAEMRALRQIGSTAASVLDSGSTGSSDWGYADGGDWGSDSSSGTENAVPPADGYQHFQYQFQCPSGQSHSIDVPYRSGMGLRLKRDLAFAALCNEADRLIQARQNCQEVFGREDCYEAPQ